MDIRGDFRETFEKISKKKKIREIISNEFKVTQNFWKFEKQGYSNFRKIYVI